MTLSVLLFVFLSLERGSSVSSLSCTPANLCTQESCVDVHGELDQDCSSNIVSEGTFGDENKCLACSVSTTYASVPKPSDLALSVRPYSTTHFELLISWSPPPGAEDLKGYKINIYANPVSTGDGVVLDDQHHYGCHCASSNVTEKTFEVTYSYQNQYQECGWEDVTRTLKVEVISVPYSAVSIIAATDNIPWPTDCLSIQPPDYAICGPPIPHPPKTTWTAELLPSSPGFMKVEVEWEVPDNAVPGYIPSEYYILVGSNPLDLTHFRVQNTTSITILPLNTSETNLLYIAVYLACVTGNEICTKQMDEYSCGDPEILGVISPPPSSSATSIVTSDHKPTATLTTSPALSSSPRSTSAPLSLLLPTSSTPSSSQLSQPTEEPFSTTAKLASIVGGACLASVLLVLILFVVTLFLVKRSGICSKKYSGRLRIPPTSPTDSERSTPNIFSTCVITNGFSFPDSSSSAPKPGVQEQQLHRILQSPSPSAEHGEATVRYKNGYQFEQDSAALPDPSKHRVVFIYSAQTPKEDCDLIAAYRKKLESQGDITTSIYDTSLRKSTSTWLADEVRVANAIFCVCNKEFQQDWQNGGGELSNSPVHALKLQVDSCVNSRHHPATFYAIVVLNEKDIQYLPDGSYLKAAVKFLLCKEKLEEIFRFIRREREYILPP